MSIDKLAEFAKDGDKNLDNLDVSKGFLQSEKPERQWFNKLFGDITGKINEVVDSIDELPPFEGGVLADTFLTVTPNLPNSVARNMRDINSNITYAKSLGIKGDGVTEDSDLFNLALLTLSNLAKADGKPRALVLDPNAVYMLKRVNLQPLVDIICLAGTATLKRVNVPVDTPETTSKWWSVLSSYNTTTWVTDADYAHRVKLHNIVFDGNIENAQWTFNTYNQEQSSCLILHGQAKSGESNKRVKFDIHNLHFKNSVSDGLHIVANADVTGGNCTSEKCFRGGLTITGGNSVVNIDGWVSDDARLDIEIDSGGTDGSLTSFITVHNYQQDIDGSANNVFAGGCDIGAVGNGGLLDLDNVKVFSPPFNWHMGRTTDDKPIHYSVRNSVFHVTNDAAFNPTEGSFDNVKFILRNDLTTSAGIKINPELYYSQSKPVDMVWNNVSMETYSKLPEHNLVRSPITIGDQTSLNKVRLKITNSDFSKVDGDVYTFALSKGGRLYLDEVSVNTTALLLAEGALAYGGLLYAVHITLGKIHFGVNTTKFMLAEFNKDSTIPNTIEYLPNFTIPQSANVFAAAGAQLGVPETLVGNRVVVGDLPPTSDTRVYKGDTYKTEKIIVGKPYEWISIKDNIMHGLSSEWVASKWVTGSFATAALPVLTTLDKGTQNIDTTLNKLVTWTGAAWV